MNARPGILLLALVSAGCTPDIPVTPIDTAATDLQLRALIGQWNVVMLGDLPEQPAAQVELGRMLLFDKVLSGNRDVSCATCHDPALAGADGMALSVGTGGTGRGSDRALGAGRQFIPRNAPSLLNQGMRTQSIFWDGRVSGSVQGPFTTPAKAAVLPPVSNILAAQALFPVTNREEMRGNPGDVDVFGNPNELALLADTAFTAIWQAVMGRLLAIPEYVQLFKAAYPAVPAASLGFQHAAQAIAAFEMSAYTRADSPFDRYLRRDDNALTVEQKRGGALFFGTARCAQCHTGAVLGGTRFENTGVPQVGPGTTPGAPLDWGRAAAVKDTNPKSRFGFRVPPLRNVELTAPYMHNGAFPTLESVVLHYEDVTNSLKSYDPSSLAPPVRAMYHGDAATVNAVLVSLNSGLRSTLNLTGEQKANLVAFLKALTDPSARELGSLKPVRVPSGLPVD